MGGGDNVMARQRSPKRDTAHTIWQNANGNITLKEIANQLDISDTQVRKWKKADNWQLSKGYAKGTQKGTQIDSKGTQKGGQNGRV